MPQTFPGMPPFLRCGAVLAVCLAGFLAGCASPPLQSARANFYAGRFEQANTNLAAIPKDDKDEILYLELINILVATPFSSIELG